MCSCTWLHTMKIISDKHHKLFIKNAPTKITVYQCQSPKMWGSLSPWWSLVQSEQEVSYVAPGLRYILHNQQRGYIPKSHPFPEHGNYMICHHIPICILEWPSGNSHMPSRNVGKGHKTWAWKYCPSASHCSRRKHRLESSCTHRNGVKQWQWDMYRYH